MVHLRPHLRRGGALVAMAVAGSALWLTPAAAVHQSTPAQQPPGADPVGSEGAGARMSPDLDGVSVSSDDLDQQARALGRAEDAHRRAEAHRYQVQDQLRALDLDLIRGFEAVAAADRALTDAEGALARARQRLVERQREGGAAAALLEDARRAVRELAIAAYIRPEDDLAGLSSDPTALLTAGRDRVLADAVGGHRIGKVAHRAGELEAARRAVATAEVEVDGAVRAVADRTGDAAAGRADVVGVGDRIAQARAEARSADEVVVTRTVEVADAVARVADARVLATVDGADFPLVALDAYWKAADAAPCPMEWWALAGITLVESGHGTHGGATLDATGLASPAIIGIPLDGQRDTAVIGDTDGGLLDGDPVFDRAVGPMQFIPSTWARWAADGDLDGVRSPHNLYDAALGAAGYLCAAAPDLTVDAGLTPGYFSYNHSLPYVVQVLGAARRYQAAVSIPAAP